MQDVLKLQISLFFTIVVGAIILTILKLDQSKKKIYKKIHESLNYADIGHRTFQTIVIYFTPKWFDFLEWLVILGFLQYISVKTGNRDVKYLYEFSCLLLIFYLMYTIDRNPIFKVSKFLSFLYSITCVFLAYLVLNFIVNTIVLLH